MKSELQLRRRERIDMRTTRAHAFNRQANKNRKPEANASVQLHWIGRHALNTVAKLGTVGCKAIISIFKQTANDGDQSLSTARDAIKRCVSLRLCMCLCMCMRVYSHVYFETNRIITITHNRKANQAQLDAR